MNIKKRSWVVFTLFALLGLWLWYSFGYAQFRFINLSVDKKTALSKAQAYLASRGINPQGYSHAIIYSPDTWADRYLQKTLGLELEKEFITQHDFELFLWEVRFFKELQKEEFIVAVSSKTAQVMAFYHLIEDVEPRQVLEKEIARRKAEDFLARTYDFDLKDYDFHEEKIKRFDKRIDFSFSWEKRGVYIPWQKEEGGAKLLVGATVSGEEVREFYRSRLDIPEKFKRHIQNQLVFGEYLTSFSTLSFFILITWAIQLAVKKRGYAVLRICKKPYLYLFGLLLAIQLLEAVNNTHHLLFMYPTSTRLYSFLGIYFFKLLISAIFLSVAFILPGLSGEALRTEMFPDKTYSGLFHYFRSTLYSRTMAGQIIFGYLLFFVFLGLQAALFHIGHKYMGVWKEWFTFSQLSSAYVPFLGAMAVGITASLSEETLFRLFGISWAKRYLRNTVLAVLVPAIIWGFGHTAYAVFPVWFRAIEVSILGLLYGYIFLAYGLIPLLVAHYLFDVFWGAAGYVLGQSSAYLFISSITVLLLPFIFAVAAFFMNRADAEREITLALDSVQVYNLEILKAFIAAKRTQGVHAEVIERELIAHHWDSTLVALAMKAA